jgi:aspartyl-tRNA(Asn)/glutamyl-tRNA(Gln) amidotransferase subunit B
MAHDYRYFPDPDLMPVEVDEAWKSAIRATCPELPFDKQRRFMEQYGVPYTITSVLVPDRGLSDFFEETARLCGKPQAAGNWIANDLLRELGAAKIELSQSKVGPAHVAGLVRLVDGGVILSNAAKEVFVDMFRTGEAPEAVVERKGLKAETNLDELERWCAEAIASNPKSVADYKGGKESALNAFKGPVMRAAKGKADPKRVDEMLRRLLAR